MAGDSVGAGAAAGAGDGEGVTVLVERSGCLSRFRYNAVERIESVPLHDAASETIVLYGDGDVVIVRYLATEVVSMVMVP